MSLTKEILRRVLVLDGAMGTQIQQAAPDEAMYRGARFEHWGCSLAGNNDLLSITAPELIRSIHTDYLEAGADIIETNTFNANAISLADFGMEHLADEINRAAVRLAREAADEYSRRTPEKPRYVVGSIGPTNKSASISPEVTNPAARNITFDELTNAYNTQIKAMIEEGVDALLIETIFDTLNAKAALCAAMQHQEVIDCKVLIMLSFTLSDVGGRTLSGQTLQAALASVAHAPIFSVGLNCSFGIKEMQPFLRELASSSPYYISAHPNAGLPNMMGEYDQTAEEMALLLKPLLQEKSLNIVGGCCGTTPTHIQAISALAMRAQPRTPQSAVAEIQLSGLEPFAVSKNANGEKQLVVVGERCNVAGSRKFLRLISEGAYEEAISIARLQVESGAQLIDVNMDDGMLDAEECMTTFLNHVASEPDVCKVPIMIDSSRWEVVEAGLRCLQGKCVVNSISLKEGEEPFLQKAKVLQELGASVVIMAFDERGQADTLDRRIEICSRAYQLLITIKFNPCDIIFDPNVLAIGTGIDEHNRYAIDFIEATRWIKTNLPGALVSGGISNLSFSFRGKNALRESIHAVFLYHALKAGLDMAIVNPNEALSIDSIPEELYNAIEDLIFDKRQDATERLIDWADNNTQREKKTTADLTDIQEMAPDERLEHAVLKGISTHIENDLASLIQRGVSPIDIIETILMKGMNRVGTLFGEGKMFLPQVVKSARTMKQAVDVLQPHLAKHSQQQDKRPKILLATVKGDVHDIGKNIVGVVLGCNNFEVIDLGVMVSTEEIVRKTKELKPDIVGLSGLITPSLDEMCKVAKAFEYERFTTPIIVGGATASLLHTAIKIAPHYSGAVLYAKDASVTPEMITNWLSNGDITQLKASYHSKAEQMTAPTLLTEEQAYERRLKVDWENYQIREPQHKGAHELEMSLHDLLPFINWRAFLATWNINPKYADGHKKTHCNSCQVSYLAQIPTTEQEQAREAIRLMEDAITTLHQLQKEGACVLTKVEFYHAATKKDNIIFEKNKERYTLHMPRQRKKGEKGACLSLADYVHPLTITDTLPDYVGAFAVAVNNEWSNQIEAATLVNDEYRRLLLQTLADRIAEAATERLHMIVRTQLWAYSPTENIPPHELPACKYEGIRPAIGYPSIPEQRDTFFLNQLLMMESIGIRLTENGAMIPSAATCGLLFAHPESRYFSVK